MLVKFVGSETDSRLLQSWKAEFPNDVTASGIFTDLSPLQPLNVPLCIIVTPSGILTEDSFPQ